MPDYSQLDLPPRCSECQGVLRPRVVLFGEEIPYDKLSRLWHEFSAGFDVIFSIGTSSLFEYIIEPVRMGREMGIPTVEINPEPTTISAEVDFKIRRSRGARPRPDLGALSRLVALAVSPPAYPPGASRPGGSENLTSPGSVFSRLGSGGLSVVPASRSGSLGYS